MHVKSWTLTDVSRNLRESSFSVSAAEVASAKGSWKISQRTLRGGLQEGVDLVEIDNGLMRILVLPTRGMGIWRAEIGEHTLGWRSPVRGPVHPMFVPITEHSGLGWLEGFDEFIVRCGLESNGAPEFDEQGRLKYPLHGRIANRPASFVDVTVDEAAGTITLRGVVEETRFHFQKLRLTATLTTAFNSTSFTISDEVENFGGTPAQMQMLYHINVGEPLLVPGSQFVAAVESIETLTAEPPAEGWETTGPAVAGSPEECYLMRLRANELGRTQVLVKNADGTAGTALEFSTNQLPCFTLWKNMVASADGYVTGIEPGTNFPKQHSTEVEAGHVVHLEPGKSWNAEYTLNWLTSVSEVSATEQVIRCL
ncbi:aldose 1-epimerase family protein [Bythopirellula polymerisocia]|uniref:DUF4432 domain-containing protein n=1 Tax=Bythopirellula polymerisocia TaxID=2528003 RepID=A0A5C6CXX1_9BACT|nr:aldose 1-epimerase family protein [Bythopirellula polymerisocia]TWU28331.1 hypothetical protein Pla144_16190 [Bythopirellula polymerisocia]